MTNDAEGTCPVNHGLRDPPMLAFPPKSAGVGSSEESGPSRPDDDYSGHGDPSHRKRNLIRLPTATRSCHGRLLVPERTALTLFACPHFSVLPELVLDV